MGATLFIPEAIRGTAHTLLVSAVASELENRGWTNHNAPQRNLCAYFPDWVNRVTFVPEMDHVSLVYYTLGQVSAAWGTDAWLAFFHADLADDAKEQQLALENMLLGIEGHGVSLEDDHEDSFKYALDKLGRLKPGCRIQPQVGDHDTDWNQLACDYITWYFESYREEPEPPSKED